MPLATITRGQGYRDDFIVTTNWIAQDNTGGARAVASLSTDGDIGTFTTIFTSGVNGDVGEIYHTGISLNTTTYSKIIIRHAGLVVGNLAARIKVTYSDASIDNFNLGSSGGYLIETFSLTPNRTLTQINIQFIANGSVTGTFVKALDFVFVFKETLTLPTILQPITFGKQRNIVELPVLGREGGVVQDLGSMAPDVAISGSLISTTSPNNYTADQWWQILVGLTLECGTVQADGNPTWQWLTTDQIQAKVLVKNFQPSAPMGRYQYWEYSLWLKQFDVIGESTVNLIGTPY